MTAPLPAFGPPPEVDLAGYARLATDVRTLLGIDLTQYKPAQIWRRVNSFARTNGHQTAAGLTAAARSDTALRERFRDMLTINVSEFFRNPEAWQQLRERVVVPMLGSQRSLRAWSAGCSLGFEAWTLAMMAREISPTTRVQIVGTDIDPLALDRARAARYTQIQMLGVSPARRAQFFNTVGTECEVKPELRGLATFRRHDLLRDPYESNFDLVMCRNTVIYFTEIAKTGLFHRMIASIRPGGVLFVGATELVANSREEGLTQLAPNIYQKGR